MNTLEITSKALLENSDLNQEDILKAINLLQERKIDFGDIFFERVVSESFALDEQIIKGGSFNISQGFGVRAVNGAKTGFAYSDIIDKKSLIESCNAARSISQENASKSICVNANFPKTNALYTSDDPIESVAREQKSAVLEILDKEARAKDPRVVQVIANLAAAHRQILVATTDGDLKADIKPSVNITVTVVMEANGKREIGSSSRGGAITLKTLIEGNDLKLLAHEAVARAAINLEAIAAPAGTMPVVLGAGWPGVLIHEAVGHGLEGDFNRTGSSTFTGRIGQKVASEACTIIDDGTIKDRRGSLSIDDEGTDGQCNMLIEKGILKGYMFDKQNAMLMGTKSTGNGRRESYNCLPQPRMTNTYLQNGDYDKEEIIKSVDKGIYAVNFSGGQVDITSGEFVFSASEAYLIENGKVTAPIKGATLIGNGPKTMQKISMVANDLEFDKGIGSCGKGGQAVPVGIGQPTLKIDEITVGGTKA